MKNVKLILFMSILISNLNFAQLSIDAFTNKEIYEYGEKIELYCKITNNSDSTFEFFAPTYQTCQAEFSFNNFNSWEHTACLATTELLTFKPHNSKIYKWVIDPIQTGLPNNDGTQKIICKYFFDLADTIFIQAPQILEGELRVEYHENNIDSIEAIRNKYNIEVLFGDGFGEIETETWKIEGINPHTLIEQIKDDSLFISIDIPIFIEYDKIVDENPFDYYPLQIGNKWVYNNVGVSYDNEPNPFNYYYSEEIIKDSIDNNGNHYFLNNSMWLRIDSSSGNIYCKNSLNDIEETLYLPLVKLNDEVLSTFYGIIKNVNFSDTLMWNQNKIQKTYEFYSLYTYQMSLVQGIGITEKKNEFDFGYSTASLKGCVVNGKIYGDTTLVGIESDESQSVPTNFSLSQNYPNPFNPTTIIEYSIPQYSVVNENFRSLQLSVFDVLGREVKTLVNEIQKPGNYKIQFDGSKFTSGVYYYQLKSDSFIQTKKMLILK
ncbi:MAG: T9SS type A sorting domain-containing protein [Melioribacteraceae bacterium]